MKRMKKLASFLLAMVMIVTMSMTAFADGTDGKITIENTTVGKTYGIYKIFDATVSGTGADTKIAYSIDSVNNKAWYDLVSATGSPFTLTAQATNNTIYNVTVADTVSNEDIITWLKSEAVANEVENMTERDYAVAIFSGLISVMSLIVSVISIIITSQQGK